MSSSGAEVRGRIFRRQGQHRSGLAAYLTDRVVPERARRRLLQSIRSPEPSHVSNGSPWPASKSQPTVRTVSDTRFRVVRPWDTYNVCACQGSLLGSLLRFWSRHGPRIAGRQETKKKTLLQVARGTHKHPHRFLNGNVVANCCANEERLDTPTGRAAGSRSTKYD